jgi:hypothetical protein
MATSNITNLTNIKELGDGSVGGTRLGKTAAELVGFHGATPSDQRAVLTLATNATHGTTRTAVIELINLLKEKGLMASA